MGPAALLLAVALPVVLRAEPNKSASGSPAIGVLPERALQALLGTGAPALHPTLIGSLTGANSPLREAVGWQARSLGELATPEGLSAEEAATYLGGWVNPVAQPVTRAAALVLSRVLSEPAAFDALAALYPGLESGPGAKLRGAIPSPFPYRGTLGSDNSALSRLAALARADPVVSRIFDGGARKPELDLDGLAVDGGRLRHPAGLSPAIQRSVAGPVFEHPRMPGAYLHVLAFRVGPDSDHPHRGIEAARIRRSLSEAGAGPRYLGRVELLDRSQAIRYAVDVGELVYGRTVRDLMNRRRFGREELGLVREMLGRLAAAGLHAEDVRTGAIVIGRTAAQSVLRAYLLNAGEVSARQGAPLPSETLEGGDRRFLDDVIQEAVFRFGQATRWERLKDALRERLGL